MQTAPGVFIELILMCFEVGDQRGTMLGTFIRLTEAIQLQTNVVEAQLLPESGTHENLFGIDIRTGKTESFNPHLMKLTIPTFLGTFVTEHLTHVIQTLRAFGGDIVLNHGTHTTRRAFRTQSQRFAIEAVDKGIHLLFYNISHLTNCPFEQRGRLDNRHADRAIRSEEHTSELQ